MENDKIRKAFKQWFFSSPENAPFPCFKAGYKSALKEAQAEIERLKCCGNCGKGRGDCYRVIDCGVPEKYKLWEAKDE